MEEARGHRVEDDDEGGRDDHEEQSIKMTVCPFFAVFELVDTIRVNICKLQIWNAPWLSTKLLKAIALHKTCRQFRIHHIVICLFFSNANIRATNSWVIYLYSPPLSFNSHRRNQKKCKNKQGYKLSDGVPQGTGTAVTQVLPLDFIWLY